MPRVFNVTFTKEFEVTIVAESEEEIRVALENCSDSDFDDWSDVSWYQHITDTLAHHRNPDKVPTTFKEPDMGVANGEAVNIVDYRQVHPAYMAALEADATEFARKLNEKKAQEKLPGTE